MKKRILLAALVLLALNPVAWAGGWQELHPSTTPGPRFGHSVVVLDGKITLYGGEGPEETVQREYGPQFSDVWRWDGIQDIFDKEEPANTPPPNRRGHGAAVSSGKMYVFFGRNDDGDVVTNVFCDNPDDKTWNFENYGGDAPDPCYYQTTASLPDGRVFSFGGLTQDGAADAYAYIYTPSQDGTPGNWVKGAPHPAGCLYGSTSVVVDGKAYVFAGKGCSDPWPTSSNVWEWNATQDKFDQIEPANDPPPARYLHQAALYGTEMWVFGGIGAGGSELNDTWKYDFTTKTWTRGPNMVRALSQGGAGVLSSNAGPVILLYGGKNGATVDDGTYQLVITDDFPWPLFLPALVRPRQE